MLTLKLHEEAKIKAARNLVPLTVHFDLTYRCHQRCLHCYIPEAWRRGEGPGPELTTAQVKSILDQLAAAGTFFLAFSGGEVFLRPDLFPILDQARRLNFSISLMTSGSRGLDQEGLRFLKDLGLHGLIVTVFALKASVHDGITGLNGSWERVMQTLRRGKELGLTMVMNCIAFPLNSGELRPLKQWARQEGIPLRLDTVLNPRWDGQPHKPGLVLTPQERTRILDLVEEAEDQSPSCELLEMYVGGCGAGWQLCYITPTGEVRPCLEIPVSCGQLNGKQNFAEMWHESPVFQKLRPVMAAPQEEVMLCKVYRNYLMTQEARPGASGKAGAGVNPSATAGQNY